MFSLSIRSKVLLLSLTLFSVPYVGYEYVLEIEDYLRDSLENSLTGAARALASVLNDRPDLFSRTLAETVREDTVLVVHSLKNGVQLDGTTEDWHEYLDQAQTYSDKHILKNQGTYTPDSLSFRHLLGKHRGYLYALFIVHDDRLIYRSASSLRLDHSDHLQIVMQDPAQQFHRYMITPTSQGWVTAYAVSQRGQPLTSQPEVRIQGTWKETIKGYVLELRIPLNMIGNRLGFAVADVDDVKTREIKTLIGTSAIHNIDTVGNVFIPSPEIEQILRSLGDTVGRRVWVLDRQRRVLAQNGDLRRELPTHPLNSLYSFLLPPASENFKDDQARASRLEGEEIIQALAGTARTRWRSTSDQQAVIVSAAYPIWVNSQVLGAVVVEETSNTIQTMQRQALANLFNKTLLVFSVVTALLLLFATRLSVRLRRLRNQAETAIDLNGRVTTTKIGSTSRDEIGDLSRSFSTILEKLKQYNNYLEGMASRLSHELRTPIAVVRSSLENLEQEQASFPEDTHIYIERAKQGIDRLNTIITRLSEATRLEQMLQNAEREVFNLTELVGNCIAGYRLAYPNQRFQADLLAVPMILEGAPDLIAQMLDKLISNAVDFAEKDSIIKVHVSYEKHFARIDVINRGNNLPDVMQERLFESMVSLRPQTGNQKEPHLGLGLYLVRLIAGYHGGQVRASNNPEGSGAMFTVFLPLTWEL